jgi:hypothetical protein
MLNPQFPYKNNQIILSSDRVVLHAKSDGIFLFGKQMVAIASNGTVNIDAKEKILIDSDVIELGNDAVLRGEPVVKGYKLINLLLEMLTTINYCGTQLSAVSKTGDAKSWLIVQETGIELRNMSERMVGLLSDTQGPNFMLSKNTFTR